MTVSNLGRFFWRELQCPDVEKAKSYYGELFGWRFEDTDMGGGATYTMIRRDGAEVGGMFPLTGEMGNVPPNWQSYVAVADLDDTLGKVRTNGGTVAYGPQAVPGVGRFAVVADPAGAVFTLMQEERATPVPTSMPAGSFCWETLTTPSFAKATEFYGSTLGWRTSTGPGGAMHVFDVGDTSIADVQETSEHPPHWLTFVVVDDLADARTRAGHGGTVIVPEIPVPEVGTIALIADPFGAHLGLFQPPRG